MLKPILIASSVAFSFGVFSQSVQRQSVGTMGKSYHGSKITVQQSIGQPFQTKTHYSEGKQSRPGFIQPSQFVIEFVKSTFKVTLDVYPNPTTAEVSFKTNENLKNLTVQVYNLAGQVIFENHIEKLRDYKLNCSDWKNGVYFIHIKDQSNNIYQSKLIKN